MRNFITSKILPLIALAAIIPLAASGYTKFNAGGLYYILQNDGDTTVSVTAQNDWLQSYDNLDGDVVIPESVTYQGKTYTVTGIDRRTFRYCTGLTSVAIPATVEAIGSEAFYGCDGLTSVNIPNSVKQISTEAFYGCSGLTSITIPGSVVEIYDRAFTCCDGLASIVVEEGNPIYDSRDNCNAIIETVSNTLIAGCKTSAIPNSVEVIEWYSFYCCTNLTSVIIPESVKTIHDNAFSGCDNLTTATIGSSVIQIDADAFSCSGLTTLHSRIKNVNDVNCCNYAFNGVDKNTCTLYVPAGTKGDYESTLPWSSFANIVEEPDSDSVATEITVNTESLTFSTITGETQEATFLVKGSHLETGLDVTLNNSDGTFSINTNEINIDEALKGAWVTVTYKPEDYGLSHASVTISGAGAEPKTVSLDGIYLTTDTREVTFDTTYSGYQSSQTITLTCPGLSKPLDLNVSNNNYFGVHQTITPEGAEVKVLFAPTRTGCVSGLLKIRYGELDLLEIPLSGIGVKSFGHIAACPTSLSFDTQPGQPVSKTFEVSFHYSNGDMMMSPGRGIEENDEATEEPVMPTVIAVNEVKPNFKPSDLIHVADPGPVERLHPIELTNKLVLELSGDECFEITPTSIYLESVPCTATVTVTYLPDCEGTNDATLTIRLNRGAAKPFVLPLTGTATPSGEIYTLPGNNDKEPSLENGLRGDAKVFANGNIIIIESPVEQSAIISDISGRAVTVNLQAGRNEISVSSSGIYIVRIREKTTKLMLR